MTNPFVAISQYQRQGKRKYTLSDRGNKLGRVAKYHPCALSPSLPPMHCITHVAPRIMTWFAAGSRIDRACVRKKGEKKKCLSENFGPISSCLFLPSAGLFRLLKSISSVNIPRVCTMSRPAAAHSLFLSFFLALHQTMCWDTRLRVARVRRDAQSVNWCLVVAWHALLPSRAEEFEAMDLLCFLGLGAGGFSALEAWKDIS